MATLLKEQSQIILGKLETAYGVDPTPTAADALFVRNISVSAEFDKADRNNITGFLGNQGAITTGAQLNIEFEVELAPSGVAGTPPPFAAALRACALAEVISDSDGDTVNDTVQYTPVDAATESATFYWRVDGLLHAATGCRGKVTIGASNGDIPVLKFSFTGLYQAPQAGQTPITGVDFSSIQSALGVYAETVPSVSLFGQAVRMKSLDVDLGNDIQMLRSMQGESVELVGRSGTVSASFWADDAEYASFVEATRTDATGALAFQLGNTAGQIFRLDVPNMQLSRSPSVSWENSAMTLGVEAAIVPTTRNSDFTLTFQ